MGRKLLFTLVLAIAGTMPFYGQPVHRMTVNVKKPGTDIAPTMYGLFFEDINFSAKVSLDITGMKRNRTLTKATITSFHSDDLYSDNVPHLQPVLEQETILPRTVAENLSSNTLDLDIAPGTFMIYRLY